MMSKGLELRSGFPALQISSAFGGTAEDQVGFDLWISAELLQEPISI
jgi:hypothetical protein